MEFTGERVVPGVTPDRILVDHLARYRFAARRVAGLRTVDVACGTGYGARMLAAGGAAPVIGVDLSPEAIGYARTHFATARVNFLVADATGEGEAAGAARPPKEGGSPPTRKARAAAKARPARE